MDGQTEATAMSGPDPILLQHLKALHDHGAADQDLEDYVQEYEHQHRFKDTSVAAPTDTGESVLPGDQRKESGAERWMGRLGAGLQGVSLGTSDELGGLTAAMGAALSGHNPIDAYTR